jgi:hypothetical protein
MNIEDCALKLMAEIAAWQANTGRQPKNQYEFITVAGYVADLVRRGGKIETARWTLLEDLKEDIRFRYIMDADDPEEVDVPECEVATVD